MLVTHNPATQSLALLLTARGETALRRQMAEKYPTAGLAVLGFGQGSWTATAPGSATLEAFIRPRNLGED
jgi:phosphohistidine phosphatase